MNNDITSVAPRHSFVIERYEAAVNEWWECNDSESLTKEKAVECANYRAKLTHIPHRVVCETVSYVVVWDSRQDKAWGNYEVQG